MVSTFDTGATGHHSSNFDHPLWSDVSVRDHSTYLFVVRWLVIKQGDSRLITSDSPSKKNEVPHLQVHWREPLERVSDGSSMALMGVG